MDNKESNSINAALSMKIEGAYCTSCVAVLTKALLKHEGVTGVKVSPQLDEVRVEYTADCFNREELEIIIKSAVSDSFISPQTEMSEKTNTQSDDFKSQTVIDPVCHMAVHIDGNSLFSNFGDAHYYFCSKSCKIAFDEDSQLFLN